MNSINFAGQQKLLFDQLNEQFCFELIKMLLDAVFSAYRQRADDELQKSWFIRRPIFQKKNNELRVKS